MTWDAAREVVVLFGGYYDYSRKSSDTWEWDGTDWRLKIAQIPLYEPFVPTIAYDSRRRRTMTFLGGPYTPYTSAELWSYGPLSPATTSPYGPACPRPSGTPALIATSLPWIGFPATFQLSGAIPGTIVALTAGMSRTQWLGATLPLTLLPSTCQVLASVELAFAGRADAQGNTQWSLPLANLPSLVGRSMFLQGYASDPALALGFATSNAIDAVVGAK